MLQPLQGVTNGCALTQGVASLALGYALVGLSARFGIKSETLEKLLLKRAFYIVLQTNICWAVYAT